MGDVPFATRLRTEFPIPPLPGRDTAIVTITTSQRAWTMSGEWGDGNPFRGSGDFNLRGNIRGIMEGEIDRPQLVSRYFLPQPVTGDPRFRSQVFRTTPSPWFEIEILSGGLVWTGLDIDTLSSRIEIADGAATMHRAHLVARADLRKLPPVPQEVEGTIFLSLDGQGRFPNPVVDGRVEAESLAYEDFRIDLLRTDLSYRADTLFWSDFAAAAGTTELHSRGMAVVAGPEQRIDARGRLRMADMPVALFNLDALRKQDRFSLALQADSIVPGPFMPPGPVLPQIGGFASLNLTAEGELREFSGDFDLVLTGPRPPRIRGSGEFALKDDTLSARSVFQAAGIDRPLIISILAPVRTDALRPPEQMIRDGTVIGVEAKRFPAGDLVQALWPQAQVTAEIDIDARTIRRGGLWDLAGSSALAVDTFTTEDTPITVSGFTARIGLNGRLDSPAVRIEADTGRFDYRDVTARITSLLATVDPEQADLNRLRLDFDPGGHMALSASLPLLPWAGILPPVGTTARVEMVDARSVLLDPLIPWGDIQGGSIDGSVTIRIDQAGLRGQGSVYTRDPVFLPDECTRSVRIGKADLILHEDSVALRVLGSMGGGEFDSRGFVVVGRDGIGDFGGRFLARDIRNRCGGRTDFGLSRAEVSVSAVNERRILWARIDLGETRIFGRVSPEKLIEELERDLRLPPLVDPVFETVDIDAEIALDRNLIINTDLGRALLDGRIVLSGTLAQPRADGHIRLAQGGVRYLDPNFTIREGIIRQYLPASIDPQREVDAITDPRIFRFGDQRDFEASLAIRGPLEDPEIFLTTDPFLIREDLLDLLTWGTIDEDEELRDDPFQVLSLYGLNTAAQYLQQRLNLSSIAITGNIFEPGGDDGPRITLTERLSPRLTLAWQIRPVDPGNQAARGVVRLFNNVNIAAGVGTGEYGELSLWYTVRR